MESHFKIDFEGLHLASRWSDADINDPWFIGAIDEVVVTKRHSYYTLVDAFGNRSKAFKHIRRISQEDAITRLMRG